ARRSRIAPPASPPSLPPRSVVPQPNLARDRAQLVARSDREDAALPPVAALERRRDEPRRLEMTAVPPERRVRVVDEHERFAHEALELHEVADVPLVRSAVALLARELRNHRLDRRPARPEPSRADVREQLRVALR